MRCPICKKEVPPGGVFVPFCGDRCRLIDLGAWASEKYRVPGPPQPAPQSEDESDEREDRN